MLTFLRRINLRVQGAWNVEYMDWQLDYSGGLFDQAKYRLGRSRLGLPNRREPLREGLIGKLVRALA